MTLSSSNGKNASDRCNADIGSEHERHRKEHKLIIPIAIFTSDDARNERDTLSMSIPEHPILHFQFLKVVLKSKDWRKFIDSDNPVAAALLAKMGYTKKERRQVRAAYLRMLLRLRVKLDDAGMALVMSVVDLYFQPSKEEDESILEELNEQYPEEGGKMMELIPAWTKWAKEEGRDEGREEGRDEERQLIIRKLLAKGFAAEEIADTLELSVDEVRKVTQS